MKMGKFFIPNKELMEKFDELLLSNQNLGYVYRLAKESARMLQATLHGDTDTMEEILEYVHDTEVPIYSYNNEVELSAIANLVYLSAEQIKHKNYKLRFQGKLAEGNLEFQRKFWELQLNIIKISAQILPVPNEHYENRL